MNPSTTNIFRKNWKMNIVSDEIDKKSLIKELHTLSNFFESNVKT